MFHKLLMLCSLTVRVSLLTKHEGVGGWTAEVEGGVAHGTLCFGLQTPPYSKPSSANKSLIVPLNTGLIITTVS